MSSLRHAFRTLWKQPGPTAVVVLTLAVAIGASTVIYSAIDLAQHFLPVVTRAGLVYAASTDTRVPQQGSSGETVVLRTPTSIPDLADWASRNSTFDAVAGASIESANLTGVDIPMRVTAIRVTANLPELWGYTPTIGRRFRPGEDRSGADQVALLTQGFWARQFSSDPRVLGQSVLLDGTPHTIVGVLPEQAGTGLFKGAEVFLPLVVDALRGARDARSVIVTGRLKPGVTLDQANTDLAAIARQLQAEYPVTNQRIGAVVLPIIEASGMNVRTLIAILGLIAILVLVVAFANLANVVVAQSMSRRHEFAVRAALGASRFDHVRQLMTESALISVAAGALGLLLAAWGVAVLRWLGGNTLGLADIQVNQRVALVALLTAFAAPLGFALWPAARMPAPESLDLKEGSRAIGTTRRTRRARSMLVALQAGAAVVLMIQITLLVRTVWTLSQVAIGFDPSQVLTLRVSVSGERYATPEALRRFGEGIATRLAALPGVAAVGTADALPIADDDQMAALTREGDAPAPPEARPRVARTAIDGGYLTTLRIPVVRGREFSAAELATASPVALVNGAAARQLWPGRDPLGLRVALDAAPGRETWLQIVGVVGNVRNADVDQGPVPAVYVSTSWRPTASVAVVVKSATADPLQLVPAIRAEVAGLDRDHPVHDVASMSQVLYDDLAGTYVLASMLSVVGLVALCLSAVGVYGIVSYSVVQRRREIGVRMALGARQAAIVRMMLAQGARPVAVGSIAGLLMSVIVALVLASAVPEMNPRDATNYAAVVLAIAAVAFLASYLPARRAAAINPVQALRAE
jgi:predicted permease